MLNTATATREELIARLEALEKGKASGNAIKVSAKGAVSVYGLQRFPVTFYANTWIKLFELAPRILEFIEAHRSELAFKEAPAAKA